MFHPHHHPLSTSSEFGLVLSGAALLWTLAAAAGAQILGLDLPAHILSVKGALWKTGCKKRPQKMSRKKRPMQKMSQIPESLTAGWEEMSLCIQLTAWSIISVEWRVLLCNTAWCRTLQESLMLSLVVQCLHCCWKHCTEWSRLANWWSAEDEWVQLLSSGFNWFLRDCRSAPGHTWPIIIGRHLQRRVSWNPAELMCHRRS